MNKRHRDPDLIYIIIVWVSLAVVAVWIVLKALGVINSPAWQELLPFASMLFGAGAFFQMFLGMNHKVEKIERKLYSMDGDIGHLRIDVEVLKSDVSYLKSDMRTVKNRLRI